MADAFATHGGPAFPHNEKNHDGSHYWSQSGMTLRDWFAGQALAGIVTNAGAHTQEDGYCKSFAEDAYRFADAMLAARDAGER